MQYDGYERKTMFGHEVAFKGDPFLLNFPTAKGKRAQKTIFIFALVKKDAKKYIETHKLKKIDHKVSQVYNEDETLDLKRKKVAFADLDDAYWAMALRLGVISEKTFDHGITMRKKNIGLAALASLGSDKHYNIIRKGEKTKDVMVVKGDDRLKQVYKMIRTECYGYMRRCSKLLGNDFLGYKTDAIYFIHTKKNIKIVEDFFKKHKLDYTLGFDHK